MDYLFYKLTIVDDFICTDKPTDRMIPNNSQLLLKYNSTRLNTIFQLPHSVIHNIL